ncbi:hypothetical protein ACP8Y2_11070 [Herpetosiphon llansteffanensis]
MRKRVLLLALIAFSCLSLTVPARSSAQTNSDYLWNFGCGWDTENSVYNVDDTSSLLTYSGTWKAETPGRQLYLGTQHITNSGGAYVSYTMDPPPYIGLYIYYTKMRNAGLADVYYNDVYVTTIDMYGPETESGCFLSIYGGLPVGTVKVKAVNRKNPLSTGTYVNIDYFNAEP